LSIPEDHHLLQLFDRDPRLHLACCVRFEQIPTAGLIPIQLREYRRHRLRANQASALNRFEHVLQFMPDDRDLVGVRKSVRTPTRSIGIYGEPVTTCSNSPSRPPGSLTAGSM